VVTQVLVIHVLKTSSENPHSSKASHASSAEHPLLLTTSRLDSGLSFCTLQDQQIRTFRGIL